MPTGKNARGEWITSEGVAGDPLHKARHALSRLPRNQEPFTAEKIRQHEGDVFVFIDSLGEFVKLDKQSLLSSISHLSDDTVIDTMVRFSDGGLWIG